MTAPISPPRRLPGIARDMVRAFERNDLLTRASAIAFQSLFALVPATLAGVAVLGFLGLGEYWREELAPTVRDNVSSDAFPVIANAVERVLVTQRGFWVTAGAAFALWQVSGATRAAGGGLDAIYGAGGDRRPVWLRLARSLAVAAGTALALGLAALGLLAGPEIVARIGPDIPGIIAVPLLRYLLPAALVVVAMGLTARFATTAPPRYRWVGLASAVTAVAWIVTTLGFRLYVTGIASYSSIFAGLASVIVLMTYLYISAVVFLGGYQLDALVRADGEPPGGSRG